jgi:hypothetical protein
LAEYVNITAGEMDAYLAPQGFQRIELPRVRELVYARRADVSGHALSLRVYTGIDPDGQSRDVGADAIRCVLAWRKADGTATVVAKSKRVHRVAGWRANLQDRIDKLTLPTDPCGSCGSPMVLRKGARGSFYGCASFPDCRATRAA